MNFSMLRMIAFTFPLLLTGCGNTYDIYYRETLVVDVDGVEQTGSGVMRLHVREDKLIPDGIGGGVHFDFSREAVAVDLGARGVLFAVSKGGRGFDGIPTYVMLRVGLVKQDMSLPDNGPRWAKKYRDFERARGTIVLVPEEYPMLVRFRDIADPATVELVDPVNLAAGFGPGVRLRQIEIEMVVPQPVTKGIENWLPWLPGRKNKTGYLRGAEFDAMHRELNMNGIEFSTELFP